MTKRKSKKPAKAYLRMIVKNISTISGTVHLTEKKGKCFILWLVLMVANVIFTSGFILFINLKYYDDQIITEIDSKCKVSQVPFPCVTICNSNLVSDRESRNVRKLLTNYNISENEITLFLQSLPNLKVTGGFNANVQHFEHITDILKSHYYDMDILMEEVHQKCENLLIYCSFNRRRQKCENIFNMIKTLDGHCCSFNYVGVDEESKQGLLSLDENIEYYDPKSDETQTSKMIATSESGRTSGLHVVFNVEPDDYPVWSLIPFNGGKVLISDPNDFPETTVVFEYFSAGDALDLKVVPLIYQADPDLQSVDPAIRNCWYPTEVALEHTDRYSFETCNTECKMYTYMRYCGCIPYKYPKQKGMRICEFVDLKCLHNVTMQVSDKERICDPVCNIECNDKRYSISSSSSPFLVSDEPDLPPGTNISHVSSVRVYYQKSSCNCYKIKLLIDLNFIIATFGGVLGMGFGVSILSVVETNILCLSTLYLVCCDFFSEYFANLKLKFLTSKVRPYVK